MKTSTVFLSAIALAGAVPGAAAARENFETSINAVQPAARALPNAPDGYTPSKVNCPAVRPRARSAAQLSTNETSWLAVRRNQTMSAMKEFFGHVHVENFDAVSYIDRIANSNSSNLPNMAIAISGGGYRSLMNGAGAIKAFDRRTENSTASGQLGGLLQSATYVAGLSGGSWLVGSVFVNNFSSISALQTSPEGTVWDFQNSIFEGPPNDTIQLVSSVSYYEHIEQAVSGKAQARFTTTITDYWGRALSYQLVNATDGGPAFTWSSIALMPEFQRAEYPMPLLVSDGRYPDELVVGGNATVYEFNPWEFGTFDPTIFGFVPLEYLGSRFVGGELPSNESCIRGYDNAGFVMGTSSSLFNEFFLHVNSTSFPTFLKDALSKILGAIGQNNLDIAEYTPNPFYHYHNSTSPYATRTSLDLVDGGEDGQNIPLHPLIQPERHVDVIFAVDSSADTSYNWPNGTSLVATYQRGLNTSGIGNGTAFPAIPDQNTFVNLGLNTRPTFFGCNSSNITGTAPLIVYLPNSPYVTFSNVSTFDPSYNTTQRDAIILNGYDMVTLANSTRDGNWTACVGCAILSRSFERTKTPVPDICNQCFQRYCWDGTLNSTTPASYDPGLVLAGVSLKSAGMALVPRTAIAMTIAAASVGALLLIA